MLVIGQSACYKLLKFIKEKKYNNGAKIQLFYTISNSYNKKL